MSFGKLAMAISDIEQLPARTLVAGVLILAAVITGAEVFFEHEHVGALEFVLDTIEKALLIFGAGGVIVLLRRSGDEKNQRETLFRDLSAARSESKVWREKAQTFINGVSVEIDKQFQAWNLSEAEREVGLFIIKGFAHKEIADMRGTAEATVRQQARNIYQKAGLPGKTAFSAYFLEDLLPPQHG